MINSNIVISDNQYWYDQFKKWAGKEFNYKKIPAPVDEYSNTKEKFSNRKKILWASRVANQKLISVLYQICKKMSAYTFVMYGENPEEEQSKDYYEKIRRLDNVIIYPYFKSISDLNSDDFDLFLYTSCYDGIPNIILEMTSLSIPVVSSKICGIPEVFGNEYELFIEEYENPKSYCEKIELFYKNPEYYYNIMSEIRKKVLDIHSRDNFRKAYLELLSKVNE